ncbi:NINE protein [Pasteurella multocida]|uniref:NINE protein n=1 Tax=Pasteurella multocida TaxID=747 RepID=UPI0024C40D61|nr:NINE protein [Pasteurella multocida]
MRVSFLFRLIFDTHILNGKLSLFRVNCQIKSDLLQLILSLILGTLAIDRFYLGDIFLGILKIVSILFYGIGLIWVLLDIYLCYQHAKYYNFEKVMSILQDS